MFWSVRRGTIGRQFFFFGTIALSYGEKMSRYECEKKKETKSDENCCGDLKITGIVH